MRRETAGGAVTGPTGRPDRRPASGRNQLKATIWPRLRNSAIPTSSRSSRNRPEEYGEVFVGMKVRHAKFGLGTIRKIEGSGEAQKAIVWFNSAGPKKLLLRFAGLERA